MQDYVVHPKRAYFFVAISILLWASFPGVSKILLRGMSNVQMLFFVTLIATVTLFCIALFQGKLEEMRIFTLRDYCVFACMGALGVFGYHLLLFAALARTTAQEAFILNYTWPVWIIVFAFLLLREPFTARKIGAVSLSFLGVVIIAYNGSSSLNFVSFSSLSSSLSSFSGFVGGAFALAAAMFYGLFSVFGKRLRYDPLLSTMMYFAFGFVFSIPMFVTTEGALSLSPLQFFGLFWIGALTMGVAFVTWFIALRGGDTAVMSNIVFLTPFLSLLITYILIREPVLISSIAGASLVVAGILLQLRSPRTELARR